MKLSWNLLFGAGFIGFSILAIFSAIKGNYDQATIRLNAALTCLVLFYVAPV